MPKEVAHPQQMNPSQADIAPLKRTVLLVAILSSLLTPFMSSAVNIALPSIGREFEMGTVLLGWTAVSYLLASAVFLVPLGRFGDIHGRKRLLTAGVSVYTLFSLLCGLSSSPIALLLFRVCQGIGAAMIFGTSLAILTSVFPASERGKALGYNVAAVYVGLSLGPFLGGLLTEHLGWRSIFLVNVPFGLLIIALLLRLEGEWAEAKGERFDAAGSLLFASSLLAIMFGFSRLPETLGAALVASGLIGMGAFVWWEKGVQYPVLQVALLLENKAFAFSNLAALINYSATAGVGFLLSLYLQYIKGLGPQEAGLVLLAQPLVQASLSPIAGRLSDRIEPRIIASSGMALTTVGLALLTSINQATSLAFIALCLMFLGLAFALFSSPNTNVVMGSVDRKYYGIASATLGTMRIVGQTISIAFAGLTLALYLGQAKVTPETQPLFLQSAKVALSVFASLCFGGIFASLARGKTHTN